MGTNGGRRAFLKLAGSGLFLTSVAGCAESESTPTTRDRVAQTDAPEPTDAPVEPTTQTESSDSIDEIIASDYAHLANISGETYPPDIEGNYSRRFEWDALGWEWWYEQQIPRSLGRYYKDRFGRSDDWTKYVHDAYGDPYIESLTDEFQSMADENDLSDRELVDLTVAFVQQLEYTEDDVSTGYDQYSSYPVETLIDRGGDCEDSSYLLAAILRELGYGVVLLGLFDAEHMAVGVKGEDSIPGTYYEYNGERYYYVETTGSGWRIGEMPDNIYPTNAEFIDVNYTPTLVYAYQTAEVPEENAVAVDFQVANVSTYHASEPEFVAEFVGMDDTIYDQDIEQLLPISGESDRTGRLLLQPPGDQPLHLRTYVLNAGNVHDTDESEERSPN